MTPEQRAASARAAEKRYREKNRERARAAALAWRAANPERAKENSRRYYVENPGYYRAWRKKNAERLRARAREKYHADIDASRAAARADQKKYRAYRASVQAKRRAALLRATPPWADKEKIEAFYREAARLTTETGIRHEVDHVWPLQGKTGCGLHVHENLQILTKPDNIRKYNNPPDQP